MKKVILIILCFIIFPLQAYSATLKSALKLTESPQHKLQRSARAIHLQTSVKQDVCTSVRPKIQMTPVLQLQLLH